MALTKRENNPVYLQVKYFRIWQPLKNQVEGCDAVETTNPKTGATVTKYGYSYNTVTGRVVKLVKYDTEKKYPTRYFGFKLHLREGRELYVLDMPFYSQILRRFLRAARNIDWYLPLSITAFKGKKQNGEEETGIWFQQRGETVRPYYTKDQPHGAPAAVYDSVDEKWDFKAQHRWLVQKLQDETVPDIDTAAARIAPPIDPAEPEPDHDPTDDRPLDTGELTDEDVPF